LPHPAATIMPRDANHSAIDTFIVQVDSAPITLKRNRSPLSARLKKFLLPAAHTMPEDANPSDIDMSTAPLVCAPTTLPRKRNKNWLLPHVTTMPEDASHSVTNMYTAALVPAPTIDNSDIEFDITHFNVVCLICTFVSIRKQIM